MTGAQEPGSLPNFPLNNAWSENKAKPRGAARSGHRQRGDSATFPPCSPPVRPPLLFPCLLTRPSSFFQGKKKKKKEPGNGATGKCLGLKRNGGAGGGGERKLNGSTSRTEGCISPHPTPGLMPTIDKTTSTTAGAHTHTRRGTAR